MFEDYFGLDLKKVGYFGATVVSTAVVVTVLYWFVFGFGHWAGEMQQASNLMMAATVTPMTANPSGIYGGPSGQSVQSAGQYLCPIHGAVGLPRYDAVGTPHCPICGSVMQFTCAPSSVPNAGFTQQWTTQPVAWNVGGGGGAGGG
ncbi:MAG: hypothetical protein HQK75_14225 [Candidatus Magnetomorum sp.]|nr:hypothetical protein [Candidatus Magnetomorum sp.]